MKEDQGLTNYLTNIILRPHREIYTIDKLGPQKTVVKSHQNSISILQSAISNFKFHSKSMQQNYCELIEINRREVTIKNQGKSIQTSIYEPQLTNKQKKNSLNLQTQDQKPYQNTKTLLKHQNQQKVYNSYENCVVFLHANSGSRLQGTEYVKHVLQYRTLCVSFDYTGSGISEGQYTTMGVNQSKDLSLVIQYITEQYGVRKFSLWGRSMGAVTGIYYLLTKYKQDYKKIQIISCIIDSPFCNLEKLVLQLASKKLNLPQFVFQPLLKIIQKDIVSKIGVNIFTELNLAQKIQKASSFERSLLNSVCFLGLASKNDRLIDCGHCQQLCKLLTPRNSRNSLLIDGLNLIKNNPNDKHLAILIDFKSQINTKGDFIYIQGDHNKPRTNEVKEKIAFFIEDNFINQKNKFIETDKQFIQKDKLQSKSAMFFNKNGLNFKSKLSFAKAARNQLKSRKNSENDDTIISIVKHEQQVPEQNYNLINLKQFRAKQHKKNSISRQRDSLKTNLNKKIYIRDEKPQKSIGINNPSAQVNQKLNRGINIICKQLNNERTKIADEMHKQTSKQNQIEQISKLPPANDACTLAVHTNVLNNSKQLQTTPYSKTPNSSLQEVTLNNISSYTASVNNSHSKDNNTMEGDEKHTQKILDAVNLSGNCVSNNNLQSLSQRVSKPQKHFQTESPARFNRNAQSQNDIPQNKQPLSIKTTPFNLSIDKSSNVSFEMQVSIQQESFRKKEKSKINAMDLSFKTQPPKTPQSKLSLSEFKNKQEESLKNNSQNKKLFFNTIKENHPGEANFTHWSPFLDYSETRGGSPAKNPKDLLQKNEGYEPICCSCQQQLSYQNSVKFKKRELISINSPNKTDKNFEQRTQLEKKNVKRETLGNPIQRNNLKNSTEMNFIQKSQIISNSFTYEANNPLSKQTTMNVRQKGFAQSSTLNGYENNSIHYQQYYHPSVTQTQYPSQSHFTTFCPDKPFINNTYYSNPTLNLQMNGFSQPNGYIGSQLKTMKSSQQPYINDYQSVRSYQANQVTFYNHNNAEPNIFICTKSKSPLSGNQTGLSSNGSMRYGVQYEQQIPKQAIDYKKKITKLLD